MKNERPVFPTADDWHSAYLQAITDGHPPWPPQTREELMLADDAGILRPEWRPARQGLRMLGLPADFGRPVKPLSESWRHRFMETLAEDTDFAAAAAHQLTGRTHE